MTLSTQQEELISSLLNKCNAPLLSLMLRISRIRGLGKSLLEFISGAINEMQPNARKRLLNAVCSNKDRNAIIDKITEHGLNKRVAQNYAQSDEDDSESDSSDVEDPSDEIERIIAPLFNPLEVRNIPLLVLMVRISSSNALWGKTFLQLVVEEINKHSSLLIHYFAWHGEVKAVKKLLQQGAAFNNSDNNGNHPLHIATLYNQTAVMEVLLKEDLELVHGHYLPPESHIENAQGQTPFSLARSTAARELLKDYTKRYYQARGLDDATKHFQRVSLRENHENLLVSQDSKNFWAKKDAMCFPRESALLSPVAQLQWKDIAHFQQYDTNVAGVRWGSGGLIDKRVFITAGHCFDPLPVSSNDPDEWFLRYSNSSVTVPSARFAGLMTVNFNYQYPQCGRTADTNPADYESKYPIEELLEYRNGKLDYAIVTLNPNPTIVGKKAQRENSSFLSLDAAPYGTLSLSTEHPQIGSTVKIGQHPQGLPKMFAKGVVQEYTDKNKKVYYAVNTEPGSSGSPVDFEDKIVAVHTDGFNRDTSPIKFNSGVLISAIKAVSQKVQELLQQSKPKGAEKNRNSNSNPKNKENVSPLRDGIFSPSSHKKPLYSELSSSGATAIYTPYHSSRGSSTSSFSSSESLNVGATSAATEKPRTSTIRNGRLSYSAW